MTQASLDYQKPTSDCSFLWVVKTYLDLISGDRPLTYRSGLKRLYVLSSGVATLNNDDIDGITNRAIDMKLLTDLQTFSQKSIAQNLYLYGQEVLRIIGDRVVMIANGDIPLVRDDADEKPDTTRLNYYVPPATFLTSLKRSVQDDVGFKDYGFKFIPSVVFPLSNLAVDIEHLLNRLSTERSHAQPDKTSWGLLTSLCEQLVDVLSQETTNIKGSMPYKTRAVPALKILWVIAKMIQGDLVRERPRHLVDQVDTEHKINISDGTLAAIPFPLKETVRAFEEEDFLGISLNAQIYLSAVNAAIFYRAGSDE